MNAVRGNLTTNRDQEYMEEFANAYRDEWNMTFL